MRINIHTYSHILYKVLAEESRENFSVIISNFVLLLARNNHLKYKLRIIDGFCDLYNKKNNIIALEVVSKNVLDKNMLERISLLYKKKSGASEVEVVHSINSKMKGGVIFKTSGEMIDESMDKRLADLKNMLIVGRA